MSLPFDPSSMDLTRAILARTTGSPCGRLRDLACAYVDGELGADQRALVQGHLGHCTACADLVRALSLSAGVLPSLAALNPGSGFTAQVLRATTRRASPAPRPLSTWDRLLRRPRAALELGFVGAAAALLLMSAPMPGRLASLAPTQPLQGAFDRVLGSALHAERRTMAALQRALPSASREVGGSPWQRMRTWMKVRWQTLRTLRGKEAAPPNP